MPKQIPQTFGTGPMPKTKKIATWESFWHGSDANRKRRFILALGLFLARVQHQKYHKSTPPSDPFGTKADQGVEHVSYPTACSAHVPRSAQPRPGLRRASDAIDVKRIARRLFVQSDCGIQFRNVGPQRSWRWRCASVAPESSRWIPQLRQLGAT